jgi:hypothetical protein
MLPAETLEMGKFILTLSLAKMRQNANATLETQKLLVYDDILQNLLQIATS